MYYVSESESLRKWGSMTNSLCTLLDGNLRAWKYRLEVILQPPGLGSVTSVAGLVVVSYDTYLYHLGTVSCNYVNGLVAKVVGLIECYTAHKYFIYHVQPHWI